MSDPKSLERLIITFPTTYDAISAEQFAQSKGQPGRLIPAPRELSAGCALAWESPLTDIEVFKAAFSELDIHWERMQLIGAKE